MKARKIKNMQPASPLEKMLERDVGTKIQGLLNTKDYCQLSRLNFSMSIFIGKHILTKRKLVHYLVQEPNEDNKNKVSSIIKNNWDLLNLKLCESTPCCTVFGLTPLQLAHGIGNTTMRDEVL